MGRTRTSFQRGCTPGPGRPKGAVSGKTLEARDRARKLIEDPEYVAGLARRLNAGEAGPMEPLLWAYAYGRPRDRAALPDHPPMLFLTTHPVGYDPLAAESQSRRLRSAGQNGAVTPVVVSADLSHGSTETGPAEGGDIEREL